MQLLTDQDGIVEQIISGILWVISFVWLSALGCFGIVSLKEGEIRAARISAGLALLGGSLYALITLLPTPFEIFFLGIFLSMVLLGCILFFLPIGKIDLGNDVPIMRFDERNVMFARANLQPGSPEYRTYYADHPENKDIDDRTRAKPGLFSPRSKFADPFLFAPAKGSFFLTDALYNAVDGPVAETQHELPPIEMTAYLKNLASYYGALSVGVAKLKSCHYYSHVGRGAGTYGEPIPVEHNYALAFTVEMAQAMVSASPNPQTSMETAKQYVEAAAVAVQLAATIRGLGYPARAHIDGNYRLIAPLVARDAGLGEIGRMGLLMIPQLGPRIRLGIVTTNVELVPDTRHADSAVIDFCSICKKCAHNCPSRSIPFDDRQEIDGALRWKINSETCFHLWSVFGTDCGRCMAVCPYSHPDNLVHNLVRWGIGSSGAFRRGALWLDDLFYGKKPVSHRAPQWTQISDMK